VCSTCGGVTSEYQSKSVSAALMSLFRLADLPKPSELGCIEFQHQPSEHDSCDIQTAMQREFTLFTLSIVY